MSQITETNFEDSDSKNVKPAVSMDDACAALRRSAYRATNRLASIRPRMLSRIVNQQLRDLSVRVNAIDTHLFRVRLDNSRDGFLGIRYHSGLAASDSDLEMLARFDFHLLPEVVRNYLLSGQIALLHGTVGGGRLITGLQKHLKCGTYILVPISVGGELKGILGVAIREEWQSANHREFFELLKLNGAILLNHVIRLRHERVRRRRLRAWRHIANQACDFAFSVDARGKILKTTPFGMADETPKLNGLRLTDVVERTFHENLESEIAIVSEKKRVRTYVFQLTLGHDGPKWYLARIEPSRGNAEIVATLYLTDNNRDKALQEENRTLADNLIKASRMGLLGQMSTEFAHQLNQPLQAMLNYCNTMQRRIAKGTNTTENSLKSLANIEKSVLHCAKIIQRIRDFVKFRTLQIDDVTVEALLDHAEMMVMPTARARNARLSFQRSETPVDVAVDQTQTTHVLVNLLVNALEATNEASELQPQIDVLVTPDPNHGRVVIRVKDNGPGLPAENPDLVFQKFYSSKEDGLGMGLAISREVCESQGGFLSAENNSDGPGCTFIVTLPLAVDPGSDTAELSSIPTIEPNID